MPKSWVIGLLFFLTSGIVGCGSDTRIKVITETISTATDTTSGLQNVRDALQKVMKQRQSEGKNLDKLDFAPALEQAKELENKGANLTKLKEYSDRFGDTTTEVEKKEFAAKYAPEITRAMESLVKEQQELTKVLAEAETMVDTPESRAQLALLRETLKTSLDKFEVLTKQR